MHLNISRACVLDMTSPVSRAPALSVSLIKDSSRSTPPPLFCSRFLRPSLFLAALGHCSRAIHRLVHAVQTILSSPYNSANRSADKYEKQRLQPLHIRASSPSSPFCFSSLLFSSCTILAIPLSYHLLPSKLALVISGCPIVLALS